MKTQIKMFLFAVALCIGSSASALGGGDRSFWLMDDITGKNHSITENSIEVCKTMPHYSIIKIDGVERRCIYSPKWGVTSVLNEYEKAKYEKIMADAKKRQP